MMLALTLALMLLPGDLGHAVVCSWPAKIDQDTLNFAFPDDSVTYWMAPFVAAPGTRLVIRGRYPDARYFSFHAYDPAQRPVAAIADYEIEPDEGANPFVARGSGGEPGRYTVYVEFGPEPERAARNTIYAGRMSDGRPNAGGVLIYRIYLADDPDDIQGGVPLPDVTFEAAGGAVQVPLGRCEPLPPSTGGQVNEQIKRWDYPEDEPGGMHAPGTYDPPLFKRFYGVDREFREWPPPNPAMEHIPKSKGGFLSNLHVAYLYARISREYGSVVVVRGRAPTFPDTRAGEPPRARAQVRYWSVCQNNGLTQRVVECLADHEVVLDRDGYFTFVISDPGDRPQNATRAHGVNWLPWGGAYYEGVIIYRHMLPAHGFDGAIQRVPEGKEPARLLRSYMPQAVYCATKEIEAAGTAACFGR